MTAKHLAIVAAAAMSMSISARVWAEDQKANPPAQSDNRTTGQKIEDSAKNAADKTGDALHKAGEKLDLTTADKASAKMSPHAEEIHDVLAQVAEASLTKKGLDDVVERFS